MLVNDIVAAKEFLDSKNNFGACNSSKLIVIGAGEGATLGAMWLAFESVRYPVRNKVPDTSMPASMNVLAAIWLDLSVKMPMGNPKTKPQDWTAALDKGLGWCEQGRDRRRPMAFLYPEMDQAAKARARGWLAKLNARGTVNHNLERGIKDAPPGPGHQLLDVRYETQKVILDYIDAVLAESGGIPWRFQTGWQADYSWMIGGVWLSTRDPANLLPRPVMLDKLGITYSER